MPSDQVEFVQSKSSQKVHKEIKTKRFWFQKKNAKLINLLKF